jgi:hypothetical protein
MGPLIVTCCSRVAAIRTALLSMVCHRPAEEIIDDCLKESDPPIERLGGQWRMSRERPMYDERRPLERRSTKEHRLPKIVHPRQMGRPVHVSNVVEDRPEQNVISHTVVEHVYETGYVTTIGDVESLLLHIGLLPIPMAPHHRRSGEPARRCT